MREVTEAQSQYLTISIKSEKEKSLWVFQREYYLLPLLSREFFTRSWRSKRGWGRYCYVEVTIKRATILALGEQKKKCYPAPTSAVAVAEAFGTKLAYG